MKSITKWILIMIIILIIVTLIVVLLWRYKSRDSNVEFLNNDEDVINLSNYDNDFLISSAGTYEVSGSFTNSIIIDAEGEEVNLVLNNVTIENDESAAIIGKNLNSLTITLKDGSINRLSDGGSSDYDGCIYSNSKLIINGTGSLEVNGSQLEGEGIATLDNDITIESGNIAITSNDDGINAGGDIGGLITINGGSLYIDALGDGIDSNNNAVINGGNIFVMGSENGGNSAIDTENGYEINGGMVIALGTDMIENPDSAGQKVISITLDNTIDEDNIVTLVNEELEEIVSFSSIKSFKTIIISTPLIEDGTYFLYQNNIHSGTLNNGVYLDGEVALNDIVEIDGNTDIAVSSDITIIGNNTLSMPEMR